MISNISNIINTPFTSTYRVSNQNNDQDSFFRFEDLCKNYEKTEGCAVWFDESISSKDLIWHKMYTLVADDSKDGEIETYCANHGILFKKYSKDELTSCDKIKSRIKAPASGLKLVEVDADRLMTIAKKQDTNLIKNQFIYKKHTKPVLYDMIKSGLEIPASYLRIMNNDFNVTDSDNFQYIRDHGAENLKNMQLSINFISLTDEPDDKMFYAFRDLGMENIPLYMDKSTYKYAKALDILAD